jgi:hypothetical protein
VAIYGVLNQVRIVKRSRPVTKRLFGGNGELFAGGLRISPRKPMVLRAFMSTISPSARPGAVRYGKGHCLSAIKEANSC